MRSILQGSILEGRMAYLLLLALLVLSKEGKRRGRGGVRQGLRPRGPYWRRPIFYHAMDRCGSIYLYRICLCIYLSSIYLLPEPLHLRLVGLVDVCRHGRRGGLVRLKQEGDEAEKSGYTATSFIQMLVPPCLEHFILSHCHRPQDHMSVGKRLCRRVKGLRRGKTAE
jgi:hypothetical protein